MSLINIITCNIVCNSKMGHCHILQVDQIINAIILDVDLLYFTQLSHLLSSGILFI